MAEFALISSDVKEDVLILLMVLVYVYLRSCLIIKRKKERGKRRIIFISPSTFLKFLKFSESSVSCIKNTYVRKPHSVPLFIYPLFTNSWIGSFWNKEKTKISYISKKRSLPSTTKLSTFILIIIIIYHFSRSIRNVTSMMAISDGIYIASF